jgi:CubicO group peptidase (beta-lactamase class C family)
VPFYLIQTDLRMRIFLLLLLLPIKLFAQDLQLEKFVDSLVGQFNKDDVPGTLIMVSEEGKPLLKKSYGMASLELNVPLTTDHAFAIGSVSKQFTAIAILQLAAAGKLKLSDDIRKFLPELNTWGQTITVHNMLSHTSGISSTERNDWAGFLHQNGVGAHHDAVLKYIMSEKLLFKPGTNFSYNNVAYYINSILIEKVSGKKFSTYMKDNVFTPAGMSHTYIATDQQPLNNLANSYTRLSEGVWRNENVRRNVWQWGNGSGNVITTVGDLSQWDMALGDGKLLPPEWLKKAWTPLVVGNDTVNYGYGFEITNYKGSTIISHNGSIYAYNCYSIHVPERKLYIFYGTCYPTDVSFIPKKIISRLLNIPIPKLSISPEKQVSDYIGNYDLLHVGGRIQSQLSDKHLYLKITASGDSLFGQYPGREKVFLKPAGQDRFMAGRPEDQFIIFKRSATRTVESVFFEPFLFGSPTAFEKNKRVEIPEKPKAVIVKVKPERLKSYAGTYYRSEKDLYFFVETDGKRLFAYELNPAARFELLPVSDDTFIRKGIEDITVSFKKNKQNLLSVTVSGPRLVEYRKILD